MCSDQVRIRHLPTGKYLALDKHTTTTVHDGPDGPVTYYGLILQNDDYSARDSCSVFKIENIKKSQPDDPIPVDDSSVRIMCEFTPPGILGEGEPIKAWLHNTDALKSNEISKHLGYNPHRPERISGMMPDSLTAAFLVADAAPPKDAFDLCPVNADIIFKTMKCISFKKVIIRNLTAYMSAAGKAF